MILTELIQTTYPENLTRRKLKRRAQFSYKKLKQFTRARIRKSKGKTKAYFRNQFMIHNAYADTKTSIARNEDIFIATSIIAAVLSFGTAVFVSDIFYLFYATAYELAEATNANMIVFTAIATGVLGTLSAWVAAFTFSALCIATMEGATRKIYRSVRKTLQTSLAAATKIATNWLLMLLLIILPLAAGAGIVLLYLLANPISQNDILALVPAGIVATLAWTAVVLINYSLAPIIVLFESDISHKHSFKRSQELVSRRGRVFILSLYVSIGTALYGAFNLAEVLQNAIGIPKIFLFSFSIFMSLLFVNIMLTTLYRKRRLARKN